MWRDSNESHGFVPLLAHKHYIEHFSNFSYRLEENYIAIIIVIELSPSPNLQWFICPDYLGYVTSERVTGSTSI